MEVVSVPQNAAQRVCEQKEVMLGAFQAVMGDYLAMLRALHKKVRILPKEDFDKAFWQMTEGMLQDVAAARFRLQAHIRQHCC
jgi:hypothetical protein